MEDVKKCANIWEGSDYKKTGKGIEVRVLKESMGSSYVLLEMGECPPPSPFFKHTCLTSQGGRS